MKDAAPDRYVVIRKGKQDPENSEYFVLDVVNDHHQREALAHLGNKYRHAGKEQLSQECFDVLKRTNEEHMRVMRARDDEYNKKMKKKR